MIQTESTVTCLVGPVLRSHYILDGIYAIIDTQILKPPHILLLHLADFYNGRKQDIGTLKKERVDIFSEFFTKIFKEKILHYVNEVLF